MINKYEVEEELKELSKIKNELIEEKLNIEANIDVDIAQDVGYTEYELYSRFSSVNEKLEDIENREYSLYNLLEKEEYV